MSYQFRALAVPDFMSREAPPNYIAGLGRGATGFTTRSDIGPARESDDGSAFQAAMAAAQGKGKRPADDDEQYQDPENETGLFNKAPYELDDEEADRIYEQIDKKMDERRRARREAREKEELEKYRKERPRIQDQFADLKQDLAKMTSEEWSNIPEVADMVRKRGAKRIKTDVYERGTYTPDSVLLEGAAQSEFTTSLDAVEQGLKPSYAEKTDFTQFGQARNKVLGLKLDQVSDSKSGQTNIDPAGYLTDLSSVSLKSDAEISDIKKARTLLKSVITSNPKHPPGWIAAARLEEVAGKMSTAREIISRGCDECPSNEDVWIEAARLATPEKAKIILANAVGHVPNSVKIWLQAKDLEKDPKAQKKVLRKALETIPDSIKLWKAVISAEEDPDDARILLSKAVECVPLAVELWLALARLETPINAQKVLNRARVANPTSHEIWMAAAKLMESNDDIVKVKKVVNSAVAELVRTGAFAERELWLNEAETAEKEGYLNVCQAIIERTLSLNLDEEEYEETWMEDAERIAENGSIETARYIYEHAVSIFPEEAIIWTNCAFFEKEKGTSIKLLSWLQRAVKACPVAELLWLMLAKEQWTGGDINAGKNTLKLAFSAIPESAQIWLAAIKLEMETKDFNKARELLKEARSKANTDKIWMKSAVLERLLKNYDAALSVLDQGLAQHSGVYKLWVIKGQILQDDLNRIEEARAHYALALKKLPRVPLLWILASRLEENNGSLIKARSLLEKARILNQKCPELWREAVLVEIRSGNSSVAKVLLAKALQECPKSGELWCEMILMENKPQRKARSTDALKKCENNPLVVTTIGRLFWSERKIDKARNWLQRAVKTDPDLGDCWAWWLKFEQSHGTTEQQKQLIEACVKAEPKHGENWTKISKDLQNIGILTADILVATAKSLHNTLK